MNFPPTTATQSTLDCGLDVLVHQDHSHPVISFQIWVETGSMHELPQPGAGLSHLLEHMVFKGTKSFDGEQLVNRVEDLGGSWNAYTTYDRTVYYLEGPSSAASEFLQLLFELVYLPTLPLADFEMEREVIRKEISMGKDDPGSAGWEHMMHALYKADGRRFPIIGSLDRFNAITHEEMVAYHEGRYTFDNSFIVLSGDIHKEQMLEALEGLAQEVPARRLVEAALPVENTLGISRRETKEFPIPMCKVSMLWPVPAHGHEDLVALDLLSAVIGGARSSLFYQKLREEKELALNLSAWCWTPKLGQGFFSIAAEVLPEKFETLHAEVLEMVNALDVTSLEADLKRAKKQTWVAQLGTLTTVSERASDLANNWFETRQLDFTRLFLEEIEAVTIEDLQRVAEKYLKNKPLVTSALVPEGFGQGESQAAQASANGIQPELRTLPNGMPLILGKDDKLPTINFQLIFKGGTRLEREEKEGIGSLYASVLGKGTQNRSYEQFVTELDEIGASLYFSGGNNTFIASGFCLEQDLPILCDLAKDCLMHPLFSPEQVEKERSLLVSKIKESSQDPLRLAFWNARRELFPDSPYRFSRLGSEETMASLTAEDLQAYHDELITNGEATLAVFGAISSEHETLIQETFGSLNYTVCESAGSELSYGQGRQDLTLDKEQAVVVISYPGASVACPDTHVLEVIQDYFGSMAGPLFSELREERGLAYYVNCNQFLGIDAGMYSFYIGTSPDRKEEALEEMQRIVDRVVETGISQAELDRVKVGLVAQNAKQDQTHPNQARSHGLNVLFGKGIEHREKNRALIADLTTEDVSKCLKKYFSDVTPVVTVVSPQNS